MQKKKINVVLVDDSVEFIYGLEVFIKSSLPEINVEASFSSSKEFLKKLPYLYSDLFLIDIEIPEVSGIDLATSIHNNNHQAKIIAITAYEDKVYIETLVKVGFCACVFKGKAVENLNNTITRVLNGEYLFPMKLHQRANL